MRKTRMLRNLLEKDGIIVAPGAYDALSARIIEEAGFDAVEVTGHGVTASLLGQADVGVLTMTEEVMVARNINNAVDVPVIADAEAGFGNAINLRRAIEEYEKAGVAAVHIEDRRTPKVFPGLQICGIEEHVKRIQAAVDAREDDDFVIIGRTDAIDTNLGIKEAIKRAKAYVEAGADAIMVHRCLRFVEKFKLFVNSIDAPLMVNHATLLRSPAPLITVQELENIGVKLVLFPLSAQLCVAKVVKGLMTELKETGTVEKFRDRMISFEELNGLVGLPKIKALEQRLLPKEVQNLSKEICAKSGARAHAKYISD